MRGMLFALFVILMLLRQTAFSHGMDKPGPHGGKIQMPGAFHTELVRVDETTWKVYLLDTAFKNPVVKKSSVVATLYSGDREVPVKCNAEQDYFLCKTARDNVTALAVKITLKVRRNGSARGIASYNLQAR